MGREIPEFFNQEVLINQKPTVVFFSDQRTLPYQVEYEEKDEVIYLKNLNCQILKVHSNDFSHQIKEIDFLYKTGSIISFLIQEDEESANYPDYTKTIFSHIQKHFPGASILFVPCLRKDRSRFDYLSQDSSITIKSYISDAFELIKEKIKKFKQKSTPFGVENIGELRPMTELILQSYENSNPDNGASSLNDQTVIQALKIHSSPSENIKAIFEDNLNVGNGSYLESIKNSVDLKTLKAEKQRIRKYSQEKRKELVSLVYGSKNFDRDGNRIKKNVEGKGFYTKGFAIDPKTLAFVITGYGGHSKTGEFLADQIMNLRHFQSMGTTTIFYDEEYEFEISSQFVSGYIYPYVKGFSSPILITECFDYWKDFYKEVVRFLNQQSFIAIDKRGDLIDGNIPKY
jgi:hypothetical protein